jgi:hypothetical protein
MILVQVTLFTQDHQTLERRVLSISTFLCIDYASKCFSLTGDRPILSLQIEESDVVAKLISGEEIPFKPTSIGKLSQFSLKGKEGYKLLLGNTAIERLQILGNSTNEAPPPSTDKQCRICYEAGSQDNPLIAPCKCVGDTQFIHRGCLQSWVHARMPSDIDTKACALCLPNAAYMCEICRGSFLASPHISMRRILRPYLEDSCPYGLFQITSFNHEPQLVAIKLNTKDVSIGRAHDADLRLSDSAVSRSHAKVVISEEEMVVMDSSKSGTWALASEVSLLKYRTIVVKVEEFMIEMKLTCRCD